MPAFLQSLPGRPPWASATRLAWTLAMVLLTHFLLEAQVVSDAAKLPSDGGSGTAAARTEAKAEGAELHLGRGYDALKNDRYDVAVDEFRAALKADPKLVLRAQFPLAVALFEAHNYAESRRELEAVRRQTGEHPNVSYYLGRIDLAERRYESAIENLTRAELKPPFPDTAYYLGFACFKQGDLTSAEKWLREAAETNPRDARIPYQLGLVLRKQGKEAEATKLLAQSDDIRRRDDSEGRLKLECGQKLDQGPRQAAYAVCEQLYDPDNAEKLTMLGTIYGQHGDPEAALKPLRRAAELAPQSPQMQYNLALNLYYLNRFEEARAPLADALKRWPDLFPLNALYGAVLVKLGDEAGAQPALARAHQLKPEDAPTIALLYGTDLSLAEKAQTEEKYADALGYLQQAADLRPQETTPHRRLAELYRTMGRPGDASREQAAADRLKQSLGPLHD